MSVRTTQKYLFKEKFASPQKFHSLKYSNYSVCSIYTRKLKLMAFIKLQKPQNFCLKALLVCVCVCVCLCACARMCVCACVCVCVYVCVSG